MMMKRWWWFFFYLQEHFAWNVVVVVVGGDDGWGMVDGDGDCDFFICKNILQGMLFASVTNEIFASQSIASFVFPMGSRRIYYAVWITIPG